MKLKDRLKIEHIPDFQFSENGLLQLNMSIKEIYDVLQPQKFDFFSELTEHGFEIDAPILASAADIKDYSELTAKDTGPWMKYTDYEQGLVNVLNNLVYYEEEFIDEETGKHGLKDSLGNILVPALFDSCKPYFDILFVDTLNVVELDGKKWLAAKDGSGKLMTSIGYDEISCSFCYGWTKRGEKYGMLDSRTGQIFVPCEMDWINDDHHAGMTSLLCKDGKLGLVEYIDPKDVTYYEPLYDAIDLATWRVFKEGRWGWVNREGEFSTNPPQSRYDIIMFEWDLEKYLGEKPRKPGEKEWYTDDELSDYLEESIRRFAAKMEMKPSEACVLPPLEIPESFSQYKSVLDKISCGNFMLKITPRSKMKAPIMSVNITADGIKVEWQPNSKELAWRDAESQLIKSCHQIIRAGDKSYTLSFAKKFERNNIADAARFIAYYYHSVWGLAETHLQIKRAPHME